MISCGLALGASATSPALSLTALTEKGDREAVAEDLVAELKQSPFDPDLAGLGSTPSLV